ncbi:TVP38/TMEM64 family protein [Bowmanella sp. JS7-9]|uniref:TVP38/TMEM64 family membrane protein n=1 Tax=Pseudobowmanella zhangzhouensis TaxID=1537679 RepID=A0ABW1XK17_9ALTE|nr:VTT domain-containing protein [Bowmanella sp. JS7-9]
MTQNSVQLRQILKGVGLILTLSVVAIFLSSVDWGGRFGVEWLKSHVEQNTYTGMLQFVLLCAGLSAVGMPRQLLAFAGGFLFATWMGTLLSTLGVTLGAACSYAVARLILSRTIAARYFGKQRSIGRFLQQQTFRKTLTIRLLPVGNNLLTNLIAGTSHTPARRFLGGSFVGYLPQMLIFALAGSGTSVGSSAKLFLGVALFIIATLLSWHLYNKTRKQVPLDWQEESEVSQS